MHIDPITDSLERAAARCDDLTPLVYALLFQRRPDFQPLFSQDTRGLARGEMLARTLDAILDRASGDAYGSMHIRAEATNHWMGLDLPASDFMVFFEAIRDSLRGLLGSGWTPPMQAAWDELIVSIHADIGGS